MYTIDESVVVADDGVHLRVRRHGRWDRDRATLVAMHGYPDDQRMWDGVSRALVDEDLVNVVTYDMRGFGQSSDTRAGGHRLGTLAGDLRAVIASLEGTRVHLLATDSGSITAWHAVCGPWAQEVVDSFVSLSGPHLGHARDFLLHAPLRARARQAASSWYVWPMLVPGLIRLGIRLGLVRRIVARLDTPHVDRDDRTLRAGRHFYRRNFPRWLLRGSPTARTSVPVLVLAPQSDLFVTAEVQRWGLRHSAKSEFVSIVGGHWVARSHPDLVAEHASRWIRDNTPASRSSSS